MLTKEERKAIAERLNKCEGLSDLYYAVIGEEAPTITSYEQDIDTLFNRLADLCDTSNMVELPLDKDGEVIHIGDTVYDKDDNLEYKVKGYLTRRNNIEIILDATKLTAYITVSAEDLTHKKPVTIASINEQLRHVLDKGHMSSWSMAKLFDIADQLEKLGDSDD